MIRSTTCCFTGHRPNRLPWGYDESDHRCLLLKDKLREAAELAYRQGYRHFICGMALGCDIYFAEILLALRERHPDITVEAALPCEEQAHRWQTADQIRHANLVAQCNYETMVQQHYTPGCMHRRDRYMVDHSSAIISAHDGNPTGGTTYTLGYAVKQKLSIVVIDVED